MIYRTIEADSSQIEIIDADNEDLYRLIDIYKSVFDTHNVFERLEEEIMEYINSEHDEQKERGGGFVIAKSKEGTIAGVLLKRRGEDSKSSHVRYRLSHLAVHPSYRGKGVGKAIMLSAEEKIRQMITSKEIKTAKLEITMSENESAAMEFFQKCGYCLEGEMKSHYRFGEKVFFFGKEIQ